MTEPEEKWVGYISDRCNMRVRTGDLVRAYATHYDRDGWTHRRLWCKKCGESAIGEGTDGADEVIVEAVFWNYRIVSVTIRDRCIPAEGGAGCSQK